LADWGIDYLKLDFVGPGGGDVFSDNREELRQWHAAIEASGRAIWLELSNYMSLDQAELWRQTANGWRIENDIECYSCNNSPDLSKHGNLTSWETVVSRFADVQPWIRFAGPGGWNDLDTLELGNGAKDGITPSERQSMFVLWAISCAPLYLGSDLTAMDADDLALIKNERLIAIDQAGVPARPVDLPMLRGKKGIQLWAARSKDGAVVLAGFNLGTDNVEIGIPLQQLDAVIDAQIANGHGVATDQISGKAVDFAGKSWALQLAPHASQVVRWSPKF
jgi:hypothetical protein